MRSHKSSYIILPVVLTYVGCASPAIQSADSATLQAATDKMIPHFECVLLYDQLKENEKVTQGIDEASTIGEQDGLSPTQIMGVYSQAKKQAVEIVLAQAIKNAAENPDRLPRLDGTSPPPAPSDELKAWKDIYEPQCADGVESQS